MKRLLITVAVAAALVSPVVAAPAHAEDVTVTITGVTARGGEILIALQTKDEYLQPRGSYGVKAASPAATGTVTVTSPGVAPGTYSVSVLHDENMDGTMAMAANGMPKEGWAMLNGDKLRAAPTFDATSFAVGNAPVVVAVWGLGRGGRGAWCGRYGCCVG